MKYGIYGFNDKSGAQYENPWLVSTHHSLIQGYRSGRR